MEQQDITLREAKNIATINNAVELITLYPSLSNENLAQRLEISIPTLYTIIKGEHAQELLRRELYHRKQQLDTRLETLWNPTDGKPNPANQRLAIKIQADIVKALADKIYPTKTETLNLNVNLDLNKLQQTQQLFDEALAMLPPTTRQQFRQNIQQLKQQHQTQ